MDKLRVGIIGLGALGESHLQAYLDLPHVEVTGVASESAEHARSIAVRYGIPRWCEGYDTLIADPGVDAISVTTEESNRRAPVIAALTAGKHVLVEAPMATALEDAREMARMAESSAGILMPGHVLRFEPRYSRLKAAVDDGQLGRLVALSARRNRPRSLATRYTGVHPAVVTAIHDLDMMLWLTSAPLHRVRAIDRLARRDNGVHGVWALLEFGRSEHDRAAEMSRGPDSRGVVATLESAWMLPDQASPTTDDAFEAIGIEGVGTIQLRGSDVELWTDKGARLQDVGYGPQQVHGASPAALREELAYFAACALSGTRPAVVTPADGVNALLAALAVIESAQRGVEVTF